MAGAFATAIDSATLPCPRRNVNSAGSISVSAGVCLLVQTFISKFATRLDAVGAT